ncbi:S-adenosylmethionine:tRNA ribosyltransferase-isomerase [Herbidospora cretacea]|uniref:S-adenosylmethionine:tRNA ribosyltransferase-isomerase n=1 Tax=Herbidospora cretacea TaxID=28444 RepID=UPI0004C426FD|nr:S-adenosylmethionine:tRNA ribosyltransferase-isomerase [Herbidospora cretacea]
MSIDFALPSVNEAHRPPEARDSVKLMVSDRRTGAITHHTFTDLPELLDPGDLVVVNNSRTLPAAVKLDRLWVHFSTELPRGEWLVELRCPGGTTYKGGAPGEWLPLPGGATLRLVERFTPRLWKARLDTDVIGYLQRHGTPIRYSYVDRDWPIDDYQTVFGRIPGSAEMPSAGRPFTTRLVTDLVARGITIAPVTLHTGVASPEKDEPPYAERFDVPAATRRLVALTKENGGRVVAVGTTVVRALETAHDEGWTSRIVSPEHPPEVVDALLTGLHEPRSTHLMMLSAVGGADLVMKSYEAALDNGYLWHEFGDVHLILGTHRIDA